MLKLQIIIKTQSAAAVSRSHSPIKVHLDAYFEVCFIYRLLDVRFSQAALVLTPIFLIYATIPLLKFLLIIISGIIIIIMMSGSLEYVLGTVAPE